MILRSLGHALVCVHLWRMHIDCNSWARHILCTHTQCAYLTICDRSHFVHILWHVTFCHKMWRMHIDCNSWVCVCVRAYMWVCMCAHVYPCVYECVYVCARFLRIYICLLQNLLWILRYTYRAIQRDVRHSTTYLYICNIYGCVRHSKRMQHMYCMLHIRDICTVCYMSHIYSHIAVYVTYI